MRRIYLQKAKTEIARPNTIRDINKQIVLNYVRERSPISRAEIARETDLQRSTISSIVDELQKIGLIEEIGIGTSTGGRKPTLLKLKIGFPVAIGIDITPNKTKIALADLAGRVLEKEEFDTSRDTRLMSEKIINHLKKIIEKYPNHDLEVGISIPGIANQSVGKTIYVPYFNWQDWNICKEIHDSLGLNAIIDNDANAIALAELWFGRENIRKVSNFVTVLVGEGVGTGIIFDGQVYRGEFGAGGEFGHMIVGEKAPVSCSCGSIECWEAHSSERSVIARYQKLNGSNQNGHGKIDFDNLISLANEGDKIAIEAFKETGKFLGIGISNLIIGLSPQAVIVNGRITKVWHLIKDELNQIAGRSVRRDIPKPTIIASTLGDETTLIGAIGLVLARKFASAAKN